MAAQADNHSGELTPEQQAAGVRTVTWAGMAVNIGLSIVKLVCGILGHSQAVVADAVHSLSDCATDIAVLVGVEYWNKPPDQCHPHGHRRIETVVTVAIGLMLAAVAVGLAYNSVVTWQKPHTGLPGVIALVAAGVSIVAKEILYHWTVAVGRRVKSKAVIANAWHHRSDAFSSIPAFIAVGGTLLMPAWFWLDHIGAIVVSLFILYAAYGIIRPAFNELIDTGAARATCLRLEQLALSVPEVQSVHDLRTRFQGGRLHIDLHVQVDPALSVHRGHEIAAAVKYKLLREGPDVADVLVHLEPFEEM
ncbi:cation transporter [bacterium]|nr:cation transporter [bacterium]